MGLLFENANAKSLDKKWCATSMLPICTPLQVPSLNKNKIVPIEVPNNPSVRFYNKKRREYRLVRPKFVWGTGLLSHLKLAALSTQPQSVTQSYRKGHLTPSRPYPQGLNSHSLPLSSVCSLRFHRHTSCRSSSFDH